MRNIKEAAVVYPEETGTVIRHDKLVRDGIPEVIAKAGKKAVWHQEKDAKELFHRLQHKLQEEAMEYRSNPCVEELADLTEVLDGMAHQQGISMGEVLQVKAQKRKERGGFEQGIVLERIE
nr:nucleoside triphosphate pyrophosphohydrolase [uncultured Anaeromusa sp.]